MHIIHFIYYANKTSLYNRIYNQTFPREGPAALLESTIGKPTFTSEPPNRTSLNTSISKKIVSGSGTSCLMSQLGPSRSLFGFRGVSKT